MFYAHLNENTTESVFDPNLNGEYNAAYGVPFCTPQAPCPNGEILSQPVSRIVDRQYALFGDATFKITDSWKFTAGVRVSHIAYDGDLVYFGPFLSPTAGASMPLAATGSNSENPITPKAVISFQPDPENLFYVSAAKGYRPGGINGELSSICGADLASIGLTTGPGIYSSDSLWSYELGAKECSFRRPHAGQRQSLRDRLEQHPAGRVPAGVRTEFRRESRQGAQRGRGSREYRPGPSIALLLDLSVAHVDAKYTGTVCAGTSACTGADATAQPVVTEGDRLPGAPWTILVSAEYSLPEFENRKPYVRLDYQFTTAQTALQPIQDPNNGVSDPTYTGLPETRNLSLRSRPALQRIRSVAIRAESNQCTADSVAYPRYQCLGLVLRPHPPPADRRHHGDISPLTRDRNSNWAHK